jgi:hypothetical protein
MAPEPTAAQLSTAPASVQVRRAADGFADALALVSETMDESPHANAINGLIGKSSTASGAQRVAAF